MSAAMEAAWVMHLAYCGIDMMHLLRLEASSLLEKEYRICNESEVMILVAMTTMYVWNTTRM